MAVTPLNHPYLPREALCALLNEAVRSPLVTLVAGAGYGKTHAVYSFLQGYGAVDVWLQLSALDNMGETFWDKFVKAVAVHDRAAAARLTAIGFPESERQFEQLSAVLVGGAVPGRRYIFVFDDFHFVRDRLVLRFVEWLAAPGIPDASVVLISREEPGINVIGMLAKRRVFQIGEEELRFGKEEMLEYFGMLGVSVTPQVAATLYDETGGWVFAIYLLGLSLKNGELQEDRALEAMKTNVFKLIDAELFCVSSKRLQKFLIGLSLIDYWSPDLLSDLSQSRKLIEEMRQLSSLIRYDSYANEYRIHHLLLEYLKKKQGSLPEKEKREIYRKTARWCAQNGYKLDAVAYYEKAEDYGGVAEVAYTLTRVTPSRVAEFLLGVLDRIPEQAYRDNVELYIIRSKMLQTLTLFDEARGEMYDVIKTYEALPAPASPIHCWLLAECYWNLGFIGLYKALHSDVHDFSEFFEKGHEYFLCSEGVIRGPKERATVGSYVSRAGYPSAKGEMSRRNEIFSRYVTYAIADKDGLMNGMHELASCEVAYFGADVKKAERLAYIAIEKARESEQFQIENRALFFLLRIYIHKAEQQRIIDILQQLKLQLENEEFLGGYTMYDIAIGWFFSQIRQTDRVAGWLKSDFDKSDLNPLLLGLEDLVRAKCCFADRRYLPALAALNGQDTAYGLEAFLLGKLELMALKSVCLHHLGEKKDALLTLHEAYSISAPDELDMPFIELGKDMRTLATAAMRDGDCSIPHAWLEKIRKKASTYAKNLSYTISEYRIFHNLNDRAHSLSNREKEILIDMCHGLSRSEIACNRSISLNTVKSLIQSIYMKLGVQNTPEAIWIAAKFKLIE
jgi:LuxR family maltose regulon positive regulatory protein